ncbi:hypothetical protein AMS68_001557 [Peltaster fructicola]|uniref:Kri1-like C-terminal domain-containing protein n=1 Tax=Peltaster fructicola TaxID=286661 RepID=A0A6H0XNH6_9PEZI|nr:hypothetical protein AMS68_001557 [Peltaster fructicola]
MERPAKRTKLLSDSEGSGDEQDGGDHGPATSKTALNINKDFARKFEHNKQREERHRLEEKLKDSDDSSTDESEDDEADLITDALDEEIMSTLKAIKSKDPRVYDKDVKFYRGFEQDVAPTSTERHKKEAPMTLQDYHRENLLSGYTGNEEAEVKPELQTYDQEQDSLRKNVVTQMHALAEQDSEDDGGFAPKINGVHNRIAPAKTRPITNADVVDADKDPETFLSNFMAAQAWRTGGSNHPQAFDSDDSADEARADAFEQAYNMRFEDPATANETLKSFARDTGKYSVRRDETGGRKRAREREKEQKEAIKQERADERARLRKLKIDEAEEKLKIIKHAAGLKGEDVEVEQWRELLEGDFSDDAWDREMQSRFGEQYYAEPDKHLDGESSTKAPTKPVWADDIDIMDLVPDFDNEGPENFSISDDQEAQDDFDKEGGTSVAPSKKSKKDREVEKRAAKAQHRRERRDIEDLVDAALPVTAAQSGGFRYRETSPNSFGLESRDILFASDAQLNQYAGLKKLASFRDEERKSRDKKKLGKKARLREWRKEVFGTADGAAGRDFDPVQADPQKKKKQSHANKKAKLRKSDSASTKS